MPPAWGQKIRATLSTVHRHKSGGLGGAKVSIRISISVPMKQSIYAFLASSSLFVFLFPLIGRLFCDFSVFRRAACFMTPSSKPTVVSADSAEPRCFADNKPLPKVLVFDLDYTLWPFWIDTHPTPPLKASTGSSAGRVVHDRFGDNLEFYPDVTGILASTKKNGIRIAAASRTHTPDLARQMLNLLHVFEDGEEEGSKKGTAPTSKPAKQYFDALEIFPGNKVAHMDGIKNKTRVAFEDMVFFDDEGRNANVERERGVCFWLVRDGVTNGEIDRGIEKWRKRRGFG